MAEGCAFFDSSRWADRIEAYACRAWDFETFLRKAPDRTFDAGLCEQLAATIPAYTAAELAVEQVGSVLERVSTAEIDISRSDVRDAWLAVNGDSVPNGCPHPIAPVDGTFCRFHMTPEERREAGISAASVAGAVEERITTVGGQAKQFVGARFAELNLATRKLIGDDNEPIDFRFVTVEGAASFAETSFGHDVSFKGAVFDGERDDRESTPSFGDHYVEFEGDIDFMRATFEGDADFKFATFGGDVRFNNATCGGAAMFNYARFDGRSDFMGVRFDGKADFSKSRFANETQLNGQFNGAGIFNYTRFEGRVDLWNTTFEEKAEFWAATFGGPLDCSYAQFRDVARFTEAQFGDTATFRNAEFRRGVMLKRVRSERGWVDLNGASVDTGVIEQTADGGTFFDLTGATVGNVELGRNGDTRHDAFEYLRIRQTKFDEFDFAAYAYALKPDWTIHTNDPTGVESPFDPPLGDLRTLNTLEQTYLRAKNGANAVGHNLAASQFFRKEMTYRRYQHWRRLFRGTVRDRLKSSWRWLSNGLLGATSGYGEEPRRTFLFSLATIVAFAVVYWLLPASPDYVGQFGQGYLLISFQSFITFILGQAPVGATPNLQFVSAVEGFVGAFLIALFVFTLTRSIHR